MLVSSAISIIISFFIVIYYYINITNKYKKLTIDQLSNISNKIVHSQQIFKLYQFLEIDKTTKDEINDLFNQLIKKINLLYIYEENKLMSILYSDSDTGDDDIGADADDTNPDTEPNDEGDTDTIDANVGDINTDVNASTDVGSKIDTVSNVETSMKPNTEIISDADYVQDIY
jgi:hypothetical protein